MGTFWAVLYLAILFMWFPNAVGRCAAQIKQAYDKQLIEGEEK